MAGHLAGGGEAAAVRLEPRAAAAPAPSPPHRRDLPTRRELPPCDPGWLEPGGAADGAVRDLSRALPRRGAAGAAAGAGDVPPFRRPRARRSALRGKPALLDRTAGGGDRL